ACLCRPIGNGANHSLVERNGLAKALDRGLQLGDLCQQARLVLYGSGLAQQVVALPIESLCLDHSLTCCRQVAQPTSSFANAHVGLGKCSYVICGPQPDKLLLMANSRLFVQAAPQKHTCQPQPRQGLLDPRPARPCTPPRPAQPTP